MKDGGEKSEYDVIIAGAGASSPTKIPSCALRPIDALDIVTDEPDTVATIAVPFAGAA